MKANTETFCAAAYGQARDYREKGYVLLPKLATLSQVDAVRREVDSLFADPVLMDPDNLRAQGRATVEGGYVVDRLDPLIDLATSAGSLARSPEVLAILEELLGQEVLLFKDKLIYKRPGTTGYRTHQDYTYYLELPAPGEEIISLMIALDATGPENGATEFYPGYHHRHLLDNKRPEDIFDPAKGLVESAEELRQVSPELLSLEPGDAVAFSSLAPHRSGPNLSAGPRRQLFLTYAAARHGDLYQPYYALFQSYLRKDRAKEGREAQTFFR